MNTQRLYAVAGAIALVVGSLAVVAQSLVTPISGNLSAAEQVARATEDHHALAWALTLDVPSMLAIPAVLVVGRLAGSATSVLASLATGLCLVPAIGGVVLYANDAVVYEAARLPDQAGAVALVDGYQSNAMVSALAACYLLTHAVGFVMLAIALHRRGSVPPWAAGALALWPFFEMGGYAVGSRPVATVGYALLAVGYVTAATRVLACSPEPVRTGA